MRDDDDPFRRRLTRGEEARPRAELSHSLVRAREAVNSTPLFERTLFPSVNSRVGTLSETLQGETLTASKIASRSASDISSESFRIISL